MPKLTRRQAMIAGLATASALAFPSVAHAQQDRPQIVVAFATQPNQLDPIFANSTPTVRILSSVFEGLLRLDYATDSSLQPAIAESWKRLDNYTVEFTLRPGVKFHDGSTVTQEDVIFSLSEERKKGPEGTGITVTSQYQATIESVTASGSDKIIIKTKVPDLALEQKLAAWSAQIISKKAFDAAGSWENWLKAPVGTGPYRIGHAQRDVGITLISHDDYWGGRPAFAEVDCLIVPESASRINGLLAGDYDIISDVSPDQIATIEANSSLEVVGGSIANVRLLAIDTNAKWLSDVRIRKALSLAIDRQLIIDQLWDNRITQAHGLQYPSFGELYFDDFPTPEFNPEKARSLLQEAGYNGDPIKYQLMNNYYPNQVLSAQAMIEMWKSVGLNVQLNMVENFGQIYQKPIDAIYDSSLSVAWPDPTALSWRGLGTGSRNYALENWTSETFMKTGQQFLESADPDERKVLAREMVQIVDDEVPAIVLHHNGGFFGKKRDVSWEPYDSLVQEFGPLNPSTGS